MANPLEASANRPLSSEVARISPLHPDSVQVLHRATLARALLGHKPTRDCSPIEARKNHRQLVAAAAIPKPEAGLVVDLECPGPAGAIPLRYYRPLGHTESEQLPVLLFLHGGGGVIGDLETHDTLCRQLTQMGQFAVVAVDYRLAPEHPFPAAIEDAFAALRWLAAGHSGLEIDIRRIAVAGDSFGANLAAVLCLMARGADLEIKAQLLMCPSFWIEAEDGSSPEFVDGPLLTAEAQAWFYEHTVGRLEHGTDWRHSATLASEHRDLPPAFVLTAGADPLQTEGEQYAEQLRRGGNIVVHRCFPGMLHGFMMMGPRVRAAAVALEELTSFAIAVFAESVHAPLSPSDSSIAV